MDLSRRAFTFSGVAGALLPNAGKLGQAAGVLSANVRSLPPFPGRPVLLEGSTYQGIWQECGPTEALVLFENRALLDSQTAANALRIAQNSHLIFFDTQREDGQLAANVKTTGMGFGQIQMVVPIAATAWELAQLSSDEQFLETSYRACGRWDAWLSAHRNTRGTGLVEGFCTYDTGMDNSPRWRGMPNQCPDHDARCCARVDGLPRLCPDLSATVFRARTALSKMAQALGRSAESQQWLEKAEALRRLIVKKLYCPEDAAFYDLDARNQWVRVRSAVNLRVLGEHVLDRNDAEHRRIFEALWARQIGNPQAFWAPYPFPSSALDEPTFVRPIPRNSWGGASQALTALRAARWMSHYGKGAEWRQLMRQWLRAISATDGFYQQLDPVTGVFTKPDPGRYSPCALVYLDCSRRLSKLKKS